MKAQLHNIDPTSITSLKISRGPAITLTWTPPERFDDNWTANVQDPGVATPYTAGVIEVTMGQGRKHRYDVEYIAHDLDEFLVTTDLTTAIVFAAFGPAEPERSRLINQARWAEAQDLSMRNMSDELIAQLTGAPVATPNGSDLIQMDDDAWAAHLATLHALNAARILPYPYADQPDTEPPTASEATQRARAFAAAQPPMTDAEWAARWRDARAHEVEPGSDREGIRAFTPARPS